MKVIKRVCVYCGSSSGFDPLYLEGARALGTHLASVGISLVYGGGKVGLMGAVADAVLAGGGEVIGVIPHHLLALEVGHDRLTSLIAVESMHQRKERMAELADAFIALPGGIGTVEELLEVLTWLQLDLHGKPIGLINTAGYYDHLLALLARMTTTGFLRAEHRDLLMVETEPASLLARMKAFVPRPIRKLRGNETDASFVPTAE